MAVAPSSGRPERLRVERGRRRRPRSRGWLVMAAGGLALVGGACGAGSSSPPAGTSPSTIPGGGPSSGASGTAAPSSTAAGGSLSQVLVAAYGLETGAVATYRNVVATLGGVRPFSNVLRSENAHVATLKALMSDHGVAVPKVSSGEPSPPTLHLACQLGVSTEKRMVAMYDAAMPAVSAYPDVARAFANLRAASHDSHLPAFERC